MILNCKQTLKGATVAVLLAIATGCQTAKQPALLDNQTFRLNEVAEDRSYGYTVENPIVAGTGNESEALLQEKRYLNALTGPTGEPVIFKKIGVCCNFKTSNVKPGGVGYLSRYKVHYRGSPDTITLFINKNDPGQPKAPAGFGFKK